MLLLNGTGIGDIAIGKALILNQKHHDIEIRSLSEKDIGQEVARFKKAVKRARTNLENMREQLPGHAPAELSAFLDAHTLMLEDPLLIDQTIGTIRTDRINAEAALHRQEESLKQVFDNISDDYLRSKKYDISQVVERVQSELSSNSSQLLALGDS